MEIAELRALGFAEGLPIEPLHTRDGTPAYAVVPLLVECGNGSRMATDIWGDIVRNFRRRAPPSDNE
ncbi:MAG: hypothetical protein ABI887_15495 [Burkholderiales bacterium]